MESPDRRLPLFWNDLPHCGLFAPECPDTLYHYTDSEGVHGIITAKALYLTKVQYLNDTSELKMAIDLFRGATKDIVKALSADDKKTFLQEVANQLGSFEKTNICVASFCEEGNLLSQWRAYGAPEGGVSLGFSKRVLMKMVKSQKIVIWKCVYDRKHQMAIMADLISNLLKSYEIAKPTTELQRENWHKNRADLIGYFNSTFLRIAPIIKHPSFSEEKEWRLITPPTSLFDKDYFVRLLNSRFVQCFKLSFPLEEEGVCDFLNEVILGPSKEDFHQISEAFLVLFAKNRIRSVTIMSSGIPYRPR